MQNYTPTAALPGSLEKIAVIAARVAAKQPSGHPADLLHDDRRGITFREHSNCKPDVNSKQIAEQIPAVVTPSNQPAKFFRIFFLRRRSLGLSVREVARRTGLHHATILQYESGARVPSLRAYHAIARALGLPVRLGNDEVACDENAAEAN